MRSLGYADGTWWGNSAGARGGGWGAGYVRQRRRQCQIVRSHLDDATSLEALQAGHVGQQVRPTALIRRHLPLGV